MSKLKQYFKLMRVHHYIKNLLVYVALICSGQFFVLEKNINCTIGFFVFCAVSSAIYILNDLWDAEKDKLHPKKCDRPIAAGMVSVTEAYILIFVLILVATVLSSLIFSWASVLLITSYIALNIAYSLGFKNIPIVDVFILVLGFLIRVLYGAAVTDIVVSDWLYLTIISLSFFLALGKRRNELKLLPKGETRKVLKNYSKKSLDKIMYMCLGLANMFYALWAMNKDEHFFIWTVPLVLLISMAYSMNIEGDSDGDPVEVFIHDKVLIVLCLIYIAVMVFCSMYSDKLCFQ